MRPPSSFAEILAAFPDMKVVARGLDVPYYTVTAWKARDAIPVNYWKGLVILARAFEVPGATHELLTQLGEAKAQERLESKQVRRSEPFRTEPPEKKPPRARSLRTDSKNARRTSSAHLAPEA